MLEIASEREAMEQAGESAAEHAMLVTKFLRRDRSGAMRRDDARNLLRRTMESYRERRGLVVYAWATLPSKVMLVVGMPVPIPLQEAMGDVFGYYTRRFNARYHRGGPLFRSRFLKALLTGPAEIRAAIDRVHAAPLLEDFAPRPGKEPVSSAQVYASGRGDSIVTIYEPGRERVFRRIAAMY